MYNISKLFASGTTYLIGSIFERALPFLFLPIYTDVLSVEDFGILSILSIMVMWPEKFVSAPIGNGITRHYYEPNYTSVRGSLIFTGYTFTFVQSVVFGAIIFAFGRQISGFLLNDASYTVYVQSFALVMIFRPLSNLMSSLARIQNNAKLYVTINIVVHASAALVQFILLLVFKLGIMSMIIGAIYISILMTILYLPNTKKIIELRFDRILLKEILSFGYPLIIAAVVALGSQTLDRIWVLKYLDLAAVGILAIAYKIPLILDFILAVPLKQTLVPVIYEMERNKTKQMEFVKIATSHITVLVVFCTLFLSASAQEIISLITSGDSYNQAAQVAPYLLLSSASQSLALLFGYGLAMEKRTFLISLTSVYILLIYVGCLSYLVPNFGLVGVGLATSIAYTCRNVIRGYLSLKYYGQTWEFKRIVTIIILGFILYGISGTFVIQNMLLSLSVNIGISLLYIMIVYSGLVFEFKDLRKIYAEVLLSRVRKKKVSV